MTTSKETAIATLARLGLTVSSHFVPWNASRHFKPNGKWIDMSLNWQVTVHKNGRPFLTTDYSAGIAHCPSYKQGKLSVDEADAIVRECTTGRKSLRSISGIPLSANKPILPDPCDVLNSLLSDASAIDYPTFEDWAGDSDYSPDSRKAEAIYRACLEIGLKLRAGLRDDGLAELKEAFRDY